MSLWSENKCHPSCTAAAYEKRGLNICRAAQMNEWQLSGGTRRRLNVRYVGESRRSVSRH